MSDSASINKAITEWFESNDLHTTHTFNIHCHKMTSIQAEALKWCRDIYLVEKRTLISGKTGE